MKMIKDRILMIQVEKEFEYKKWGEEIPYMQFPSHWKVKIIPPFCGAIIRFEVQTILNTHVSVYLDCYDMLGYMGEPYWEIYPSADGEPERFVMDDVDGLLAAIQRSLDRQEKEEKIRNN